ncbi:5-formyltetrahydrofolate cyclo-ligase [Parabacteroides sp. OttesenSCG-928-B22]|nr:5-formyltetrahydrofolate cyclo-ligase [Parabacteroides sp. OttesenSCG-928-B22]
MEISKAKQALRKDMASLKKEYSTTILSEKSTNACSLLEETKLFQEAAYIALYHAMPDEVQTAALIEKWYRQKTILLPVIEGDDIRMLPYRGKETVKPGLFGILEPVAGEETAAYQIDLLIAPGVAFDRLGNRLGRGRGYYDRLLTSLSAPRLGLCFDFQLHDEIPAEPFDIPMQGIVTDREIIRLSI